MLQFNSISLLNNDIKQLSFNEFTKKIQQYSLKKKVQEFLHFLKIKNIRCSVFLIIYVINGYSKYIMDDSEISTNLIELSTKILNNVKLLIEKKSNLNNDIKNQIIEFNKQFTEWKKQDYEKQLIYYSDSYYELEQIKKIGNHQIYNNEINKIQDKLKKNIINLNKQNGLTFLKEYEQTFLNKKKIEKIHIKQTLTYTMKKAFWDTLKEELKKDPPNLTMIPNILKDINHSLKSLVPNNEQYKQNIDEYIDYEFLGNMINNNSFTYDSIFSLADFILNCLLELGIPEKDSEVKDLQKWIDTTKKNPTQFKLYEFLPKLFNEIMDKIEEIQFCITLLKKSSK